ncbi:MAG: type I restriction enzyme HsdR N-terminal domain-containing protein [Opitutaceae bacterium]|nr:type I restriction enzyme HsdR N-terminal domain-containing protein [Cytophagales bacterium]
MFDLNLPKADIKMVYKNSKPYILDLVRKKWLLLTPEEYVRQNFIWYLIHHLRYPVSLISVERGVKVNRLLNRSDIVVYNQHSLPQILIECKAPQVKITQDTLEQASKYNTKLKAEFLCVTNGLEHAFYRINFENSQYERLKNLPTYLPIS